MNAKPNPSEDPLEALLRETPTPLADDGFSLRVLTALPPPATKPRRLPGRRTIACSLGALTGLALARAGSGPLQASDYTAFGATLVTSTARAANFLSDPTVLTLGALTLASLAVAYAREISARLD